MFPEIIIVLALLVTVDLKLMDWSERVLMIELKGFEIGECFK